MVQVHDLLEGKMMRKITRTIAPLIIGGALGVAWGVVPANAASNQFTVTVQAPNRILASQPVFKGEHLTVGLDGFKETVTGVTGDSNVAHLQFALPSTVHGTVLVTIH